MRRGKVTEVDKSPDWIAHDGLEAFRFQWSPDSRWLTYARPAGTSNNAIFLFDTRTAQLQQATSGYLNDTQPVFDPEGKYLFYASDRAFDPVYGTFDNTWTYANPTQLVAVPLRKDVKSPLAARNDAESPAGRHRQAEPTKKAEEDDDKPAEKPPRAGERRHRSRRLRSARRRAAAEIGHLRGSAGGARANCCTGERRAPARTKRRVRWCSSISRSAKRKRSSTMPTGSR